MELIERKKIRIELIKQWDDNPRKNKKEAVQKVIESIEKFGVVRDLVLSQDNVICIGDTQYQAMKELDLKLIDVAIYQMSEDEFIELNAADNKTGEYAKWDNKKLLERFKILGSEKASKVPGFQSKQIDKIFGHKSTTVSTTEEAGDGIASDIKVESETDSRAIIKKKILQFSKREHEGVTLRLGVLKKELKLGSEAEVIMHLLKDVQVPADPILKKGPMQVVNAEE